MAKYLKFKLEPASPQEALGKKLDEAPLQHAEALLKAYALLDTASQHGILDLLRGAITAEDAILDKVAGYANTPEGIRIMRNLMVLGKLLAAVSPDFLRQASSDLTASVAAEAKRPKAGLFATARRIFGGDALRGLQIAMAALESLGRTARQAEKGSR